MEQLKAANMELPVIVKPAAACGVAAAHSMAIVLRPSGFADLRVPLPAVVQEYVDHGAQLHKVYMLGPQVRPHVSGELELHWPSSWALYVNTHESPPSVIMVCWQEYTRTKRSIPDLHFPGAELQAAPAAVHFDSLQTMPLSFDWLPIAAASPTETRDSNPQFDMAAVEAAATWLRAELQLRLFGFDVVVDKSSGNQFTASFVALLLLYCMPAALHLSNTSAATDMYQLSIACDGRCSCRDRHQLLPKLCGHSRSAQRFAGGNTGQHYVTGQAVLADAHMIELRLAVPPHHPLPCPQVPQYRPRQRQRQSVLPR